MTPKEQAKLEALNEATAPTDLVEACQMISL